ncbi:hypothetical protein EO98_19385 [Methanosarcina sp. 2.H.T.1A.6]|uniref:hypothetical protein n=1 Tax=unclassified Methanosarcina TaxID=2644672 RepID=UPI00062190F9|nr:MULTISPECIES: hypothetical protein [unclassified Methanosarcina]KKG18194.1 hypothetical protein EO94_09985 [Methanosarcina sp. 2.H.T.1A.3]KKG19419.1 hypothetical protein EO98_19385 [Methanosarcina sp. 2.H.T.1A.6]KKG25540.1 hypothetical protein EO96_18460 [Methanosarcina sp. 2.H.T.1A.8]KKG26583.1 hypothetical protein EO97_01695 [Methanosarcina sp. 2.H.T.1A.15]
MNPKFDELQMLNRQKIAFQTLIFTLALIFVDGFVKTFYIWATPMVEALVLLSIPTVFFTTRAIMKNAYFVMGTKIKKEIWGFGAICAFGIIIFAQSIFSGTLNIIENGMLSDDVSFPILILTYIFIVLAMVVKAVQERKEGKNVDE